MKSFRVDLHMHTRHSRDGVLPPAELIRRAKAAGLDRIAITDHNTVDGAREAAAMDPGLVIIGEEIDCAEGVHLIGLYLQERIPPRLPVAHTAARIREQGGVVYAPHPFAYVWRPRDRPQLVLAVADVIEVFNARAFIPAWNRAAATAAGRALLPTAAGTDTHFGREVGGAFTEIPPFDDAASLRAALPHARPVIRRRATPVLHFASLGVHLFRLLAARGR